MHFKDTSRFLFVGLIITRQIRAKCGAIFNWMVLGHFSFSHLIYLLLGHTTKEGCYFWSHKRT
jgi:hypothetical protein